MAIVLVPGPPEGLSIIRSNVPALLGGDVVGLDGGGGAGLEVAKAQPIYTGSLQDVIDGRLLAGAHLTGWQYLILSGQTVRAAAELTSVAIGSDQWKYSSLHEPCGSLAEDAIRAAERLPQVKQLKYQLRILRVPALYLYAIWLYRNGDDWLVPAAPTPSVLEPNRSYTEAQLTEALRPFAIARSMPEEEEQAQQ
jgi:hypothetical protein